ncbi:MAG: glycosyltransferase [Candidatus Promineifilaceae bacterium]|nr:glycosyltransferase [Candidatus Promineifilaceae bacterium]
MATLITKWFSMAVVTGPLALYSERRYRALPELPPSTLTFDLPALSIIIPARNEADNLRRLLPTLASAFYPGSLELIVVDDNSVDETAQVARDLGASVISLASIPEGWSGKTYACHRGAMASTGEWLLFTDADTVHHPRGPAHAVAYAERKGLDGLSLFIRPVTSGFADSLTLPVAFAGLFLGLGTDRSVLNGQYILLSRNVYTKSRGFAAVARETLEDLALGHHLQQNGFHVPLLHSDVVASVHMYAGTVDLWQGLVRLGAGSLRWFGARALITALFVTGAMAPILALVAALRQRRKRRWAVASWAVVTAGFIPWASRFGAVWTALLAPVGALIVQMAAVWGLIRRVAGQGVPWKGRRV